MTMMMMTAATSAQAVSMRRAILPTLKQSEMDFTLLVAAVSTGLANFQASLIEREQSAPPTALAAHDLLQFESGD
jgi:hypothetical protein